jgi:hypothetical protein
MALTVVCLNILTTSTTGEIKKAGEWGGGGGVGGGCKTSVPIPAAEWPFMSNSTVRYIIYLQIYYIILNISMYFIYIFIWILPVLRIQTISTGSGYGSDLLKKPDMDPDLFIFSTNVLRKKFCKKMANKTYL